MKQRKELMLSMVQELLKTKWFIFSVVLKAWRTTGSFLQLIFIPLFLKTQLHLSHFQLFFFHFCLLFVLLWQHLNCWLSARPSNFPFGSCRIKLQKKEKKKCCIYLHKRATKASSPPPPPSQGWGRRWKYSITMWQKTVIEQQN